MFAAQEDDVATDFEREFFASKVLGAVGQQTARIRSAEITGFLAMAGLAHDRGLMVVGRAVNGWMDEDEGIRCDQLGIPSEVERYAKLVQKSVGGDDEKDECPMRWVTERWGCGERYNTKRSAFWRCIRLVVRDMGIADVENAGWPSHLVWSNLYKVSPHKGGNPSNALCEIQFQGCAELLKLEFRTYQPSRILFLTGIEWATGFPGVDELQGVAGCQYVVRAGDANGARCVVAVHPQGKPEVQWVREVVAAFGR